MMGWNLSADATAPPNVRSLHHETIGPASVDRTFAFFADPTNLERLTPPWLKFRILTPMPIEMGAGVAIDYQISLYGLPIRWTSRIDVWEPGIRFVDRQTVGPYRWWNHEHRFAPVAEGTRVIDHVEYVPRFAWLTGAFVRRDLDRIFGFRQDALRKIFASESDR